MFPFNTLTFEIRYYYFFLVSVFKGLFFLIRESVSFSIETFGSLYLFIYLFIYFWLLNSTSYIFYPSVLIANHIYFATFLYVIIIF